MEIIFNEAQYAIIRHSKINISRLTLRQAESPWHSCAHDICDLRSAMDWRSTVGVQVPTKAIFVSEDQDISVRGICWWISPIVRHIGASQLDSASESCLRMSKATDFSDGLQTSWDRNYLCDHLTMFSIDIETNLSFRREVRLPTMRLMWRLTGTGISALPQHSYR